MTDKEKIINEIQRRINLFRKDGKLGSDTEIALYGLINFINSMHEEPVSEDLEEEVYEHLWKGRMGKDVSKPIYFSYDELLEVARHFANWQKQQLMKKAIEGIVTTNIDG